MLYKPLGNNFDNCFIYKIESTKMRNTSKYLKHIILLGYSLTNTTNNNNQQIKVKVFSDYKLNFRFNSKFNISNSIAY